MYTAIWMAVQWNSFFIQFEHNDKVCAKAGRVTVSEWVSAREVRREIKSKNSEKSKGQRVWVASSYIKWKYISSGQETGAV